MDSNESLLQGAKSKIQKLALNATVRFNEPRSTDDNYAAHQLGSTATSTLENAELTKALETVYGHNENLKRHNDELQALLADAQDEIFTMREEVEVHLANPPIQWGSFHSIISVLHWLVSDDFWKAMKIKRLGALLPLHSNRTRILWIHSYLIHALTRGMKNSRVNHRYGEVLAWYYRTVMSLYWCFLGVSPNLIGMSSMSKLNQNYHSWNDPWVKSMTSKVKSRLTRNQRPTRAWKSQLVRQPWLWDSASQIMQTSLIYSKRDNFLKSFFLIGIFSYWLYCLKFIWLASAKYGSRPGLVGFLLPGVLSFILVQNFGRHNITVQVKQRFLL